MTFVVGIEIQMEFYFSFSFVKNFGVGVRSWDRMKAPKLFDLTYLQKNETSCRMIHEYRTSLVLDDKKVTVPFEVACLLGKSRERLTCSETGSLLGAKKKSPTKKVSLPKA